MSTEMPVVVIDPGHGGTTDTGGSSHNNAVGPNGLLEKNLTLDIALRVKAHLQGVATVILTRETDVNLSLADRAKVAHDNRATLFLSIHLNGFSDANVDGTELWIHKDASIRSHNFADAVLSGLVAVTHVANRGVRNADFGVLKPQRHLPGTASCLAEIAFLTNPQQASKLQDDSYKEQIALALTTAIRSSLPTSPAHSLENEENEADITSFFQRLRSPAPNTGTPNGYDERMPTEVVVSMVRNSHGDYESRTLPRVSSPREIVRFTYLDCGRWGGPGGLASAGRQYSFGIIWGTWAALCRFVPNANMDAAANYIRNDNGSRQDNPINDVIDSLRSADTSVELVKALWSPFTTPNLDWNTVYVLLPDFHLPIVGVKPNPPNDGPAMGRYEFSSGPGQWFDRYLAGDIFGQQSGQAAILLSKFVNNLGRARIKDRINLVQLGDMYDLWIGLDQFFAGSQNQEVILRSSGGVTAQDFITFWVNKTNSLFPTMVRDLNNTPVGHKTFLWGNHDNYLGAFTPPGLPRRIRNIRGAGVFIEHGHRADSSNRDGADGRFSGHSITNMVFAHPTLRRLDPNRRMTFINAAASSFVSNRNFGVYAMGHTHSPFLSTIKIEVYDPII